jgi:predicted nuclease of predicted toxin-antitoxin system
VRFLADENLDFAVVRSLRAAGHDVRALVEETNRTVDSDVIALAASESRILLTEGKDFGWLAFVAGNGGVGVVLVRFPASARATLGASVLDLVTVNGEVLAGSFTVLQPGHARITPGPPRSSRGG